MCIFGCSPAASSLICLHNIVYEQRQAGTGGRGLRVRERWARLSHGGRKSKKKEKKDQVKTDVCEATYKDALWQKWDYLSSGDDV